MKTRVKAALILPLLAVSLGYITYLLYLLSLDRRIPPVRPDQGSTSPLVAADEPYSPDALAEDLERLAEIYASVRVSSIGRSCLGRDIPLVTMGRGNRKILVIGAFHAREWMTSLLLARMIEEYARADEKREALGRYDVAHLLERVTLLFVPMLDPDGVEISQKGLEVAGVDRAMLLRANDGGRDLTRWKANARGVNLNIQYDAGWDDAFSLEWPHFEKYKGTGVESEPESRALADLTRREEPDLALCYHSSGRIIYWFYGQKGADYNRDFSLAKAISRLTGYRIGKEKREDTHGGFKDWFIRRFDRPAFTVEIGRHSGERPLPLDCFDEVWRENRFVVLDMAERLLARD